MSDQEAARAALRDFLTTRRERITPATPGCPRSADVAGSKGSVAKRSRCWPESAPEYYIRLERGAAVGISSEIVDSVATALHLDGDERVHLDRLIAALTPRARRKRRLAKPDAISPESR